MTGQEPTDLELACREVARAVLWNKGTASTDLVETLALKYLAIAEDHQHFVRQQREDDDVIANAVRYIAHVHTMPPHGTDTAWFSNALSVLMELAVPNTGLTETAAMFLPNVQEGIRESLADVPVSRLTMRIEDDDASFLRWIQDAGVQYGAVSDLLDLLEKLYHGDPLHPEDQKTLYMAAVAAPLTRKAREG